MNFRPTTPTPHDCPCAKCRRDRARAYVAKLAGMKAVKCDFCDRKFVDEFARDEHTKAKHPNTLSDARRLAENLISTTTSLTADGNAEPAKVASALNLIQQEREQQIAKGYDAAHDDGHKNGEILATAHELIASVSGYVLSERKGSCDHWHIIKKWGHDRVRMMTIAAALIVAEIERVQRLSAEPAKVPTHCDKCGKTLGAAWVSPGGKGNFCSGECAYPPGAVLTTAEPAKSAPSVAKPLPNRPANNPGNEWESDVEADNLYNRMRHVSGADDCTEMARALDAARAEGHAAGLAQGRAEGLREAEGMARDLPKEWGYKAKIAAEEIADAIKLLRETGSVAVPGKEEAK